MTVSDILSKRSCFLPVLDFSFCFSIFLLIQKIVVKLFSWLQLKDNVNVAGLCDSPSPQSCCRVAEA